MSGTRCPACDFLNHPDATASAVDGPLYCNQCGLTYYAGTLADQLADPMRFLESSRIVWSRDWDALAVGFVCGIVSNVVASWITGWFW